MSSSTNSGARNLSIRGSSFSNDEDQILCHVYLEISQDPITGINQRKDKMWERIHLLYHERLPPHITEQRTTKSLQNRFSIITTSVTRFRGDIRQIENMRPSGYSEQQIIDKAKVKYKNESSKAEAKKGFQFDHVWPILKDAEKWTNTSVMNTPIGQKQRSRFESSESESPTSESPRASFCINLNADFEEQQPSSEPMRSFERPTGLKKEKAKRKQSELRTKELDSIKEESREIVEAIKMKASKRDEILTQIKNNYNLQMIQAQNNANKIAAKDKRETRKIMQEKRKIMENDLDSIKDPLHREYLRTEKIKNLQKMAHVEQLQAPPTTFSQFSNSFGGSRSSSVFGQFSSALRGSGSSAIYNDGSFNGFGQFQGGNGGSEDKLSKY